MILNHLVEMKTLQRFAHEMDFAKQTYSSFIHLFRKYLTESSLIFTACFFDNRH
jgi:ABC-type histidine transport system ATPase subunit